MSFEPAIPVAVLILAAIAAFGWLIWTAATSQGRSRWLRHVALTVAALSVVAGPGLTGQTERKTQLQDIDVVFAVDLTTSMVAEDYDGDRPRLEGVQADIEDLLEDLAGARFSLVTFGADAVIEIPFTTDRNAVASVVDTLRVEPYLLARGSSIERPVDEVADLLEGADESMPDRARLVFVFGDGEIVGDDSGPSSSYDELADLVQGGLVLGYGTTEGGRMREGTIDIDEEGDYVTDSHGDIALSRIDEDALMSAASDLGVDYVHRTTTGGLGGLVDTDDISVESTGEQTTARRDLSWIPALALGALVLAELWDLAATGARTRRWWAT